MEKKPRYTVSYPLTQFVKRLTASAPTHAHACWELLLFDRGISCNIVNGIRYENMSHGDIFILGPHHLHEIKVVQEPHSHWDIYCSDERMRKLCAFFEDGFYAQLSDNAPPPI